MTNKYLKALQRELIIRVEESHTYYRARNKDLTLHGILNTIADRLVWFHPYDSSAYWANSSNLLKYILDRMDEDTELRYVECRLSKTQPKTGACWLIEKNAPCITKILIPKLKM